MAKIVLVGVEPATERQICLLASLKGHHIDRQPQNVTCHELRGADVVFGGGEPIHYMTLLRQLREALPSVRFVAVARMPTTTEWLDALEAGATDYCSPPVSMPQLRWIMDSALQNELATSLSRAAAVP